ncbi:hypothetical protein [Salinicola avicenniae]|uniref:hypothetical protein n=1 Tax=Salinicola avicenniae TaxID=2916836 RepID=UPI002073DA3B|nr:MULTISPECIES: hypothetical protein [unclassified Salinicola]
MFTSRSLRWLTICNLSLFALPLFALPVWAADDCSSATLRQQIQQQTRQIDSYLSASDNPQTTQNQMASMARGLRESGQVADHSDEMKQLASGAEFDPSQAFCDDLRTTMDAVRVYMNTHPQ